MPCPTCLAIRALLESQGVDYQVAASIGDRVGHAVERKVKRKVSAHARRVGRAMKRLSRKHRLKSGKWRKGWNQSRLMRAAQKEARRK